MRACGERARAAWLAAVLVSACNGQFDFDTALLDAGHPPIIVPEGGPDDVASTGEPVADMPRTRVHIACGGSDCISSGCCSGSSGATCVDVAEGGVCGGLLIQCDDTEDCPAGQVCCAEAEDRVSAYDCRDASACEVERVHCEPESHCRGLNFVILCNPDRPSPCSQCVSTTLKGLPAGYHQCAAEP